MIYSLALFLSISASGWLFAKNIFFLYYIYANIICNFINQSPSLRLCYLRKNIAQSLINTLCLALKRNSVFLRVFSWLYCLNVLFVSWHFQVRSFFVTKQELSQIHIHILLQPPFCFQRFFVELPLPVYFLIIMITEQNMR